MTKTISQDVVLRECFYGLSGIAAAQFIPNLTWKNGILLSAFNGACVSIGEKLTLPDSFIIPKVALIAGALICLTTIEGLLMKPLIMEAVIGFTLCNAFAETTHRVVMAVAFTPRTTTNLHNDSRSGSREYLRRRLVQEELDEIPSPVTTQISGRTTQKVNSCAFQAIGFIEHILSGGSINTPEDVDRLVKNSEAKYREAGFKAHLASSIEASEHFNVLTALVGTNFVSNTFGGTVAEKKARISKVVKNLSTFYFCKNPNSFDHFGISIANGTYAHALTVSKTNQRGVYEYQIFDSHRNFAFNPNGGGSASVHKTTDLETALNQLEHLPGIKKYMITIVPLIIYSEANIMFLNRTRKKELCLESLTRLTEFMALHSLEWIHVNLDIAEDENKYNHHLIVSKAQQKGVYEYKVYDEDKLEETTHDLEEALAKLFKLPGMLGEHCNPWIFMPDNEELCSQKESDELEGVLDDVLFSFRLKRQF